MPISNLSSGLRPGVCTSTTRPTAPFEGQMIYETDTDMLAIWNGSAWRYVAATTPTNGTVLQVVSTTKSDTFSTNSSSFTDVTGLSATITPKSTSSKVLVNVSLSGTGTTGTTNLFARLMRDSTAIGVGDAAGSRIQASLATRDQEFPQSINVMYLDSPSSTASIIYKVQVRNQGSGDVVVNRTLNATDAAANVRTISTITLMEIAG